MNLDDFAQIKIQHVIVIEGCFDPMEVFCPYEPPYLTAKNCILQIQCKNQVMFVFHVVQSHVLESRRMLASMSPRPRVPRPSPTTQSPSPRSTFSDSLSVDPQEICNTTYFHINWVRIL